MTAPHSYLPIEMEEKIKDLKKLLEKVHENDELLSKLLEDDHVSARLKAEERVEELERELEQANKMVKELQGRNMGQLRQLQAVRAALNSKAKNPIEEQAHQVFQALKSALPEHPLVTYDNEENRRGMHIRLSGTELRFIYSLLSWAASKLGDMGCNDYYLNDPSEAEIWFMRQVWKWDMEIGCDYGDDVPDLEEEAKVKDGRLWGPGNSVPPHYLMHRLKECYGDGLFEDAEGLT